MIARGGVLPLSCPEVSRLMNMPVLTPAPAGGSPVPVGPAPARRRLARAMDLVEGVVYWGILAVGVGFPFLGAAYAFIRS